MKPPGNASVLSQAKTAQQKGTSFPESAGHVTGNHHWRHLVSAVKSKLWCHLVTNNYTSRDQILPSAHGMYAWVLWFDRCIVY